MHEDLIAQARRLGRDQRVPEPIQVALMRGAYLLGEAQDDTVGRFREAELLTHIEVANNAIELAGLLPPT